MANDTSTEHNLIQITKDKPDKSLKTLSTETCERYGSENKRRALFTSESTLTQQLTRHSGPDHDLANGHKKIKHRYKSVLRSRQFT